MKFIEDAREAPSKGSGRSGKTSSPVLLGVLILIAILLLSGFSPLFEGRYLAPSIPAPNVYAEFPGLGVEAPYATHSTALQSLPEPVQEWRLPGYQLGQQMAPPWVVPGDATSSQVPSPRSAQPSSSNQSYTSAQWTMLSPSSYPSPRMGAAMAFDSALGEVVLFGGYSATGYQNDTWAYSQGTWTNITSEVSGAPSPRYDALMTFDASDGYLLLEGGYTMGGLTNSSTYSFNGTGWTEEETLPAEGYTSDLTGPALTYDALDNEVIWDGGGDGGYGTTWSYHAGVWTHVSSSDPCSYVDPLAYDGADGYVLSVGSPETTNGSYSTCRYTASTGWGYLGVNENPTYGGYAMMAFDSAANATILPLSKVWPAFCATPYSCSQTWAYNGGIWTNITALSSSQPSGRTAPGLAYDPLTQQVVMFGGANESVMLGDTWTLSVTSSSKTYPVTFQESGLPPSTDWSVNLGSQTQGSSNSTISLSEPNGSYAWSLNPVPDYTTSTSSGSVTVNGGSPAPVDIVFQMVPLSGVNVTFPNPSSDGGYVENNTQLELLATPLCGGSPCNTPAAYRWNITNPGYGSLHPTTLNLTTLDVGSESGTVAIFVNVTIQNVTVQSSPVVISIWNFSTYPAYVSISPQNSSVGNGLQLPLGAATSCTSGVCPPPALGGYQWGVSGSPGGSITWSDALANYHAGTGTGVEEIWANVTFNGVTAHAAPDRVEVTSYLDIESFTVSPRAISEDGTVFYNVTATGGTPPYTYTYDNLPPGCASQNVSSLACTPDQAGTFSSTTVNVRGGFENETAGPISLTVEPSGYAVIHSFSVSPSSIPLGGETYLNVSASGGGTPYTYFYSGLPSGCTPLNVSSLACTPLVPGNFTVWAIVNTSTHLESTSDPVSLSVVSSGPGPGPSIDGFSATPNPIDLGYRTTLHVDVIGGVTPYTYSYEGLPSGCFSENSASLSCYPTENGTYLVEVVVTDAENVSTAATFYLHVSPPLSLDFLGTPPSSVDEGQTFSVALTASGGTGPVSIVPSSEPSRFNCSSSTGKNPVVFSCLVVGELGVAALVFNATDATNVSDETETAIEIDPFLYAYLDVTPSQVEAGEGVTFSGEGLGGQGPYVYNFSGMPPGCVDVDQASSIYYCVPTQPGDYNVTLTVEDANSWTQNATVEVVVLFGFLVHAPKSVSVGESFYLNLTVAGGVPPLTFSYSGLPLGCSSQDTASLKCTPTVAGYYNVSIEVIDAVGHLAVQTIPLDVTPQASSSGPSVWAEYEWEFVLAGSAVVIGMVLLGVNFRRTRSREDILGKDKGSSTLPDAKALYGDYLKPSKPPSGLPPPASPAGSGKGLGEAVDDLL